MSEKWGPCTSCHGSGNLRKSGGCLACNGSGQSGDVKDYLKIELQSEDEEFLRAMDDAEHHSKTKVGL